MRMSRATSYEPQRHHHLRFASVEGGALEDHMRAQSSHSALFGHFRGVGRKRSGLVCRVKKFLPSKKVLYSSGVECDHE